MKLIQKDTAYDYDPPALDNHGKNASIKKHMFDQSCSLTQDIEMLDASLELTAEDGREYSFRGGRNSGDGRRPIKDATNILVFSE